MKPTNTISSPPFADRIRRVIAASPPLRDSAAEAHLLEIVRLDERIRSAAPGAADPSDLARFRDHIHKLNTLLTGPCTLVDLLRSVAQKPYNQYE